MQFRLLHRDGGPLQDWHVEKEYETTTDLVLDGGPAATFFLNHPYANYLQYDHGPGLEWRYERIT